MGADIPRQTDYVARAEAAARRGRQRARPDRHRLHPRRDQLFARTRAAGRAIIPR